MIRTYTLDCHAANPQMPLEPVCPYTGSAATFVLINLPRPHGKQRIDAVTLSITNADAAVSAHPATREGSSWIVTVPASAIGPAGNVREAIIISASGVDEQNRPVPSWIVAVADLRVKNQDGTAVPGEPRVIISWFASRPSNPRGVFICPNPDGQAMLDLYDGHNYRPLVTGGVTLDNTVTKDSANPVKSSGIWSAIWGTLAALPTGISSLYDWCASKLAEKRDLDDLDIPATPWRLSSGFEDWTVQQFDLGPEAYGWGFYDPSGVMIGNSDYSQTEEQRDARTSIVMMEGRDPELIGRVSATRTLADSIATVRGVDAAIASHHDSTKQDEITASGILKGDGSGGVTQAEKSSTSADPANADYRDPQDNTCHKTEFTEWSFSGSAVDPEVEYSIVVKPAGEDEYEDYYFLYGDGNWIATTTFPKGSSVSNIGPNNWNGHQDITATRSAFCTDGKKFVTEDVAAKQSDIPALATPSDTATDAQAAKARATYDFVNSSINAMAAFYITKNAAGDSFATKAELTAAIASGTFYNGGQPRVPTKNDYLYILADESHPTAAGTSPTTRYSFDGTQWSFQIVVNDTALTAAQLAAMNSGINAALVTWLTTFKGTDSATTLVSILAAISDKADASDIFGNDGKPTDTFATDLFGKQVAISAVQDIVNDMFDNGDTTAYPRTTEG